MNSFEEPVADSKLPDGSLWAHFKKIAPIVISRRAIKENICRYEQD